MTMAPWRVRQSALSLRNKHNMALVTIEDLVAYRQAHERKAS